MSAATRDEGTIGRWTEGCAVHSSTARRPTRSARADQQGAVCRLPAPPARGGPDAGRPVRPERAAPLPGPGHQPRRCANFIRILAGERLETRPNATSEVYYVIRGRGRSRLREGELPWQEGDFFALPAGSRAEHHAEADAAFYWVHDEPLLRYLGVKADAPRFEPTLYPQGEGRRRAGGSREGPQGGRSGAASASCWPTGSSTRPGPSRT